MTPPQPLPLELAGAAIRLWPDHALSWDDARTLFIADPHFGKAASFRQLGLPAPDPTSADLDRLARLLEHAAATRLVVLGDFFHARSAQSPAVLESLARWRALHPRLEILLVRGNHDRHAGDPPASLDIACVEEGWPLGPFLCRHEPEPSPRGYVLAGHLHPGWILRDRNGASLRSPCFAVSPAMAVLPAFGSFTGLHPLRRTRHTRIFVATPDRVVPLPPG